MTIHEAEKVKQRNKDLFQNFRASDFDLNQNSSQEQKTDNGLDDM